MGRKELRLRGKTSFVAALALLLASMAVSSVIVFSAAPDMSWYRTNGGIGTDAYTAVVQTGDGSYTVAGYTDSSGAGGFDILVDKYDSSGNQLWSKTFGGTGDDVANSLFQTSPSGFAVVGSSASGATGFDSFLGRYDSNGNFLGSSTYGGAGVDIGNSGIQTGDGRFVVVGSTTSLGNGGNDFFTAMYDPSGVQLWSKTFGGAGNDIANSVAQLNDGTLVVGGSTTSFGSGAEDFAMVGYDQSGNQLWGTFYGGTGADTLYSLAKTNDGGFVAGGSTTSYGSGAGANALLLKYDGSGSREWSVVFGGSGEDTIRSVIQTSEGGFAWTGETTSYGGSGTGSNVWVLKTDSKGNYQASGTFGGTGSDSAYCIIQTIDGGYCLAGRTASYGAGGWDAYLIKTAPWVLSTPSPTPKPTPSPTSTPTATPTPTPTPSPTPTSTPSPTPTATPSPSPPPTPTPSPAPTAAPTPAPTPSPTKTPQPTPQATPTPTPSISSSPSPTPIATSRPVNFLGLPSEYDLPLAIGLVTVGSGVTAASIYHYKKRQEEEYVHVRTKPTPASEMDLKKMEEDFAADQLRQFKRKKEEREEKEAFWQGFLRGLLRDRIQGLKERREKQEKEE